jgi:hypothetical protein
MKKDNIVIFGAVMAGIGNSIYMRHPAPVKDNLISRTINQSILTSTQHMGGFGS